MIEQSQVDKVVFYSKILKKEMAMTVYLPKGYDEHGQALPVVYFLHGRSGNEDLMYQLDIPARADKLLTEDKINPMIIVCPSIENSRGLNSSKECKEIADPGNSGLMIQVGRYEDYFITEVLQQIDEKYHTIKDKTGRFVGGISGGGYAALHYAFTYPNLFGKVGGHMPAVGLTLEEDDKPYFTSQENWEACDPISIARDKTLPKDLKVYLDAGDQDEGQFNKSCEILQELLDSQKVESELHISKGHHNGAYIMSHLDEYLLFYGK